MRAILIGAFAVVAALALVACSSVVPRENGTWDVPRQVERRSVVGTNQSAMLIQNCKSEQVRWYWENDYTDCTDVVPYHHAASPGVGGQIGSGMAIGAGLGFGLGFQGRSLATQQNQFIDNVQPGGGHSVGK